MILALCLAYIVPLCTAEFLCISGTKWCDDYDDIWTDLRQNKFIQM